MDLNIRVSTWLQVDFTSGGEGRGCSVETWFSMVIHTTVLSATEVSRGANEEVVAGERMVMLEVEEASPCMKNDILNVII
jgi:hypothetical protein